MQTYPFQNSLIACLGKTSKLVGLFMAQRLQDSNLDLTGKQWFMLRMLSVKDGQRQNDLAIITDRNKTSLVRLIDTLEKKNLVVRKSDPNDKRVNRIYLTGHGISMYKTSLPIVLAAMQELQAGISDSEVKATIDILNKVQQNILALQTDEC